MANWSKAEQKVIDTIESIETIEQLEELRKMTKSEFEKTGDWRTGFVFDRICVELAKRRAAQIRTLWE